MLVTVGACTVIAVGVATVPAAADPSTCSDKEVITGVCSRGSNTSTGTVISAESTGESHGSQDSEWTPPEGWQLCANGWVSPLQMQFGSGACRDILTVTGPPTPTLSDFREFYPAATEITSEPQGWALKGRPFNPIASSTPTTRTGTVLGLPTEVTFTPFRWNWDYGDSVTASSTTGGATWAALDQPRFTRTATSHIYPSRGDFVLGLTVDYTVTYRLGTGPTRPIDGVLSIPAVPVSTRVVVGSTVLTDRPCSPTDRATC